MSMKVLASKISISHFLLMFTSLALKTDKIKLDEATRNPSLDFLFFCVQCMFLSLCTSDWVIVSSGSGKSAKMPSSDIYPCCLSKTIQAAISFSLSDTFCQLHVGENMQENILKTPADLSPAVFQQRLFYLRSFCCCSKITSANGNTAYYN